jgi:hypothetical protein
MNLRATPRIAPFTKPALWTGATRKVGDTKYRLFDDGSYRLYPPKVRGKSAHRQAKRLRQYVIARRT